MSKCAVVSTCGLGRDFTLMGEALPVVPNYRDLGVIVDPKLTFSAHLASVLLSATRVTNTLFRCFVIKRPDFYFKLYVSLVIPKLLYCCQVWRPFRKSDILSLEKFQRKFIRRVSLRCDVPRDSLCLPSISELFDNADAQMYKRMSFLESHSKIFNVNINNLRSNCTITTKDIARYDRVNNMFAWRYCRSLHVMK